MGQSVKNKNRTTGTVLGIDPGTRVLGWAIVSSTGRTFQLCVSGVIKPDAKHPYPQRLDAIYTGLREVIEQHKPEQAAIEEVFAGRNVQTALKIGEARGVVMAALGAAGLEAGSYSARRIKRAVTGNGAADKSQVARMVAMQLGLASPPEPDDITDACAVAMTHLILLRTPQ
jgi:crossover junction endodeoxyribonuclease RuvC